MPAKKSPDVPKMDDDMRGYLALAAERAAAEPPPDSQPVAVGRAITERTQMWLAEGGPQMHRTEERWIMGPGRYVLCRIHWPVEARSLPVLVFVHGGGWTFNSIYTHDRLAREYAARAGVAVVAPDYSLSPEYKFPLALNECVSVVEWIAREGRSWGLDPARIAIGGDSAGANLALGAAVALRDRGQSPLKALLLNYGVFDSDLESPSYRAFAEGFGLTRARMRMFWDYYVASPDQLVHPYAAPLRADLAGLPPMRINVAELDPLAHENTSLHKKAKAAGIESECKVYRGVVHGFMRALPHVAKGEAAVAESAEWLTRALGTAGKAKAAKKGKAKQTA